MNVLILTEIYPPDTGGAATYANLLAEELSNYKSVNSVYVLTEYSTNSSFIDQTEKINIYRVLPDKFNKLNSNKFIKLIYALLFQIVLLFCAVWISVAKKIDVIHINNGGILIVNGVGFNNLFAIILMIIKVFRRVKIIADARGPGAIWKRGYDFGFNWIDKMICCSNNTYNKAIDNGFEAKKLVHVSVPVRDIKDEIELYKNRFWNKYQPYWPYIIFVGAINQNKGVAELIEAFNILEREDYRYSLILIGKMDYDKILPAINNNQYIHYLGTLNHDEVLAAISFAELLILPSKSEGMPRVCLEAIQVGTEVLFPPNIPEFNRYCDNYVLSEVTVKEILNKIKYALDKRRAISYPIENHYVKNVIGETYRLYVSN